ncbi:MAG: HlyD family efflux transporter periplasmic adaptor subunit, partial [Isosphaeraceae bacterium]
RAGVVYQLPAQAGERVAAGGDLCLLGPTGGAASDQPVQSPIAARVLDIPVHEGEAVEPGATLATLESPEVAPHAVLYVPADMGYQVRPGMEARVEPAGSAPGGAGALSGRVVNAGRYPVSRAAIAGMLSDEWRADPTSRGSPLLEVVVALTPEAMAPGPGPTSSDSFPGIYSGTPCRATITVDRLRPLRLIVSGRSGRAGS